MAALQQDRVSTRKLPPAAQTAYDRLMIWASARDRSGIAAPAPTLQQQEVLSQLQARDAGLFVGAVWALVEALGNGPRGRRQKRQYGRRNTQMALRRLEAERLIVPYAPGRFRSIAYLIFAEPIEREFAEALLAGAPQGLLRRLARRELQAEEQLELDVAPSNDVVIEMNGEQYTELPPLLPLSQLALAVLDRLQRLSKGVKARMSPALSIRQQVALGDAEVAGKCWFLVEALAQKVRYPENDLSPRAVQAALRELEAHGWIVPYELGPLGGTAYLLFKNAVDHATIARLWDVAPKAFVLRMKRSRYVDRDKGDQPIAQSISGYRNAKERQQASGAAAQDLNPPEEFLPQAPGISAPSAASQSPDEPEATPALRQPPPASSPDGGLDDVTLLQQLQGDPGLDDAAVTLALQVDTLVRAVRTDVEKQAVREVRRAVLRFLERNQQVPLVERLQAVAGQLRGLHAKKQPPRNAGGYVWAALVEGYTFPAAPTPPPAVAPALVAAEAPEPAPPQESARQRRERQQRIVDEDSRQIAAAQQRGLSIAEAAERVHRGERFTDDAEESAAAAAADEAQPAVEQIDVPDPAWVAIVESATSTSFSAWEYGRGIECVRTDDGVLLLSSEFLWGPMLEIWRELFWDELVAAAAAQGLKLRWVPAAKPASRKEEAMFTGAP